MITNEELQKAWAIVRQAVSEGVECKSNLHPDWGVLDKGWASELTLRVRPKELWVFYTKNGILARVSEESPMQQSQYEHHVIRFTEVMKELPE